jgi:hypothetical protein
MSGEAALAGLHAVVERFQAACARDPRVVAAFLGGSLAAANADEHSDLDLYVVAREEDCAALVEARVEFVAGFGEPAFVGVTRDFEGLGFDMLHFVLASGACGEVAITHAGSFRSSHGGPHRVLVDKAGVLSGVEFPRASRTPEQARAATERALSWFWLHLIGLQKALARERPWVAHHQLERLRSCLLEILAAAALPAADARAHERALAQSVVGLEPDAALRAGRRLVEIYGAVAPRAAARLGATVPHALARVAEGKFRAGR